MKKLRAVGVIVLFLGLTIAPSINANTSRDNELVEITTEICGLGGGKKTAQLSRGEAEEVEQLIDDIEQRLDEVETREEAVEVFNEAIVELYNYGLLGGLSVKQAQRLATGKCRDLKLIRILNIFNQIEGKNPVKNDDIINRNCLFIAYTYGAFEINIWSLISFILHIIYREYLPLKLIYLLAILTIEYSLRKILRFINQIDIGVGVAYFYFTLGLYGIKIGNHDFHTADWFSGLKIYFNYHQYRTLYIGSALRVTKKYVPWIDI